MKNKQTASEKYSENMKNQGFIKSCVWIPEEDKQKLSAYARRMRNIYIREKQNSDS